MKSTPAPVYVGIDVAEDKLEVALGLTAEIQTFVNDLEGFDLLLAALKDQAVTLIILEATDGFETGIACALQAAGWPVAVINPMPARDLIKVLGYLAKPGCIDARALAELARVIDQHPERTRFVKPLSTAERAWLQALVVRQHQLVTMLVAEYERMAISHDATRPSLKIIIQALEQQLANIKTKLAHYIATHRVDVAALLATVHVILIHGVGMPRERLFGERIEENVRKLNLSTEPIFTHIDWHEVVEKPYTVFPFLNSQQIAELMKGFVGAAWRGHSIKLPLQLLDIMLLFAPLALWILMALLFYWIEDTLANAPPSARWLQTPVWILWTSFAWPLPLGIYNYAVQPLLGYLLVVLTIVAITFLLCTIRCGVLDAVRVIAVGLIRPIIFFAAIPTRPTIIALLLISGIIAGFWKVPPWDKRDPQLKVFPHDTLVIAPIEPPTSYELATKDSEKSFIRIIVMFIIGIILACLIGAILIFPLKVLADIICYMGNREYYERLLDHVEERISPTQIGTYKYILLVGHSLGSVIALDWLLRSKEKLDPSLRIGLVTMGSPIRRFISAFFSKSFPTADTAAAELALHFKGFRWINVYRPFDPIGASLFQVGDDRTRDCSTGQRNKLAIWAHTGYWNDETVLRLIHRYLVAPHNVVE